MSKSDKEIKYPIPTKSHWDNKGTWKCVCTTPTHKKGQRFDSPQCSYCIEVKDA